MMYVMQYNVIQYDSVACLLDMIVGWNRKPQLIDSTDIELNEYSE